MQLRQRTQSGCTDAAAPLPDVVRGAVLSRRPFPLIILSAVICLSSTVEWRRSIDS